MVPGLQAHPHRHNQHRSRKRWIDIVRQVVFGCNIPGSLLERQQKHFPDRKDLIVQKKLARKVPDPPKKKVPKLRLAHYPIRSKKQFILKNTMLFAFNKCALLNVSFDEHIQLHNHHQNVDI